jgi:tetratricopeptide (TPR) repeat protein
MAERPQVERVCAHAVAFAAGLAFALSLLLLAPPAGASRPAQNNQNKAPKVADDEPTPRGKGNPSPTPASTPRTPRPRLYEVTFVTSVPEVDIFVKGGGMSMTPLGNSKTDGILKTHLAAGRHRIIASRQGHQILSETIEVHPRANRIDLTITAVVSKPREEPAPTPEPPAPEPTPPAKTPEEEAAENAARVRQIIANFIDPGRVDEAPISEWEFVLEQTGAALARDPANTSLQAQAHLAEGQRAFLKSDLPTAVKHFEQAARLEPNLLPALYGLGNAYLRSALYADAFNTYKRASVVDKKFALAYRGMRDALIKQNKLKDAKQYDALYRDNGGAATPDDRLSAAVVLMKDKRWPDALRELEEVVKTRDTAEVNVLIGDCYTEMKRPQKALQFYRTAVELDGKSALAHFKYGKAMFGFNEYEVAAKELRRALELDPAPGAVIIRDDRKRADEMADEAEKKIAEAQKKMKERE